VFGFRGGRSFGGGICWGKIVYENLSIRGGGCQREVGEVVFRGWCVLEGAWGWGCVVLGVKKSGYGGKQSKARREGHSQLSTMIPRRGQPVKF